MLNCEGSKTVCANYCKENASLFFSIEKGSTAAMRVVNIEAIENFCAGVAYSCIQHNFIYVHISWKSAEFKFLSLVQKSSVFSRSLHKKVDKTVSWNSDEGNFMYISLGLI